mmetsp:Transcript_6932/g.20050  ORF Transcript_6932/g.20050 Transcript_6932/m.20050 type:complete len:202 (-) Transcript_6932:273-878(-)
MVFDGELHHHPCCGIIIIVAAAAAARFLGSSPAPFVFRRRNSNEPAQHLTNRSTQVLAVAVVLRVSFLLLFRFLGSAKDERDKGFFPKRFFHQIREFLSQFRSRNGIGLGVRFRFHVFSFGTPRDLPRCEIGLRQSRNPSPRRDRWRRPLSMKKISAIVYCPARWSTYPPRSVDIGVEHKCVDDDERTVPLVVAAEDSGPR